MNRNTADPRITRISTAPSAAHRVSYPRLGLFVALSALLAMVAGIAEGGVWTQSDVDWYVGIAGGQTSSVLQPFASRQLGPLLVRGMMHLLHFDVHTGFAIEGVVCLLATLTLVGYILLRSGVPTFSLIAVGGLTVWATLFNGLALPDLFYSALVGLFLLFLYRERYLWAALMLLPLYVARESTILLLVCFLIAGWRLIRPVHALIALVAAFAGMRIVKHLVAAAPGNRENISPLAYMVGKLPWNFAKNVLGLPLWASNNSSNCAVPRWQWGLHLGSIHAVGVCSYKPSYTLWTVFLALTSFGLLPLVCVYLGRRFPRLLWPESMILRFCVVYGVISFLLAPNLGASVPRLYSYAWPLLAIGAPLLALRFLNLPPKSARWFLLLHLAVSWSMLLEHRLLPVVPEVLLVFAAAIAYVVAWRMLAKSEAAPMARPA